MLLEPTTQPETAPPVDDTRTVLTGASADLGVPVLPRDLRPYALRARHLPAVRRTMAQLLLGRHWDAASTAEVLGLPRADVDALAAVRRPGTAAGHVAEQLAARHGGPPAPVEPAPVEPALVEPAPAVRVPLPRTG